jgi:hypothetical protein
MPRLRAILVVLAIVGLCAAPGRAEGATAAEQQEAKRALDRALSLFEQPVGAARYLPSAAVDPHEATLVLRDLAVRVADLSDSDQTHARLLLARPDEGLGAAFGHGYRVPGRSECTVHVCFHWVDSTRDAPPRADRDGDSVPDYVETAEAVLEEVWATEIDRYGYRPPKTDAESINHGPDERLDVYLVDVGDDGIYGYCTTDDPNIGSGYAYGDLSAYCVLDNDFTPAQFPGSTTPDEALRVTAAHEFFHAVQFGYDAYEDGWFMEGTAVWMEDEVYDEIDDNHQYLQASALARPDVPLDLAVRDFTDPLAGFQYGSFVFWRYLSERFGTPDVVRRVWELADDAPGGTDRYSLAAVEAMLLERNSAFRTTFAAFGAANVFPESFYEEGAVYPSPVLHRHSTLSRSAPAAGDRLTLDHLTSWYASYHPGARTPRGARLRVTLDLPTRARGADAAIVLLSRSGSVRVLGMSLDDQGKGRRTVPFDRGQISQVVLVLSNASSRFRCWQATGLSCQGLPLDDSTPYRYDVRVVG